jgi:dihydropteroate synthase
MTLNQILDLARPNVMGILNVTPDSFSDGGRFIGRDAALGQALAMVNEGADIIDIGGESTRPGATAVSVDQELQRVIPVIEAVREVTSLPISIDTSKPRVMREAVAAGASLINDVRALREEGALEAAAELGVPVCLMHMRGEPRTMQEQPQYKDVVAEICDFLAGRVEACEGAGLNRGQLLVDPGFGFGKRLEHNLELLRRLGEFRRLGLPLLVGISRKSMIGAILGEVPVEERSHGSVAAALIAASQGASVLRVHDVRASVDALKVQRAVFGDNAVLN